MAEESMIIDHPNRDKASSKATKAVVIVLLLATAVLMAIVTVGGWNALQGAKMVQVAYILLYLLTAFYVARWNRGVLPVIAALAIILLIFAGVATPEWFARDKTGFTDPAVPSEVLGLITAIIIPVQVLLIAFAMRGFQQAWNVEVERRAPDQSSGAGRPAAAQA